MHIKRLMTTRPNRRVAVVVSQKVSKKATVRNRIKRVLLGAINKDVLERKPVFDMVIVAQPGVIKNIKEASKWLANLIRTT